MPAKRTHPTSQDSKHAKGKYWLWVGVSLLFIVIITAWTCLIITAKTNLPELIPPPNQQP